MNKSYNKFTLKDLEEAVNKIFDKSRKQSNNFVIYCSPKMAQVFDITVKEDLGLISPERAALERNAAINNAYIHPEWDYLKYPQIYLNNPYKDSFTNEIFEDGEEDIYGDYKLIYIGRKEL